MMTLDWIEEPISSAHDRKSFDCGVVELNTYLARFARQNHTNNSAKTYVAVSPVDQKKVLGFYTISPGSLAYSRTPLNVSKNLPRYDVGGFTLGRLATDKQLQGQGFGGQLLLSAGRRCVRVASETGGTILIIQAKNERAALWYESFGATRLEDEPLMLVLPLATIEDALKQHGKL